MSVDAFRKFIAKWGAYIFGLMFVAFALTFVSGQNYCNRGTNPGIADNAPAIATVGDFKATSFEVEQLANSNNANTAGATGPQSMAQSYASQTSNVIDHLFTLALASEKGINMDDKAVEEAIPSLWAQQLENRKGQMEQAGQLKPNATDAEVSATFKRFFGMTVDEAKQQWESDFHQVFNDPAKKELVRAEIAGAQLGEQYNSRSTITDDQLRNSFGSYKVLKLNVLDKPGTNAQDVANQALAAIKGGMRFEDAIKKFSNDTPVSGKSLTDSEDVQSFMFELSPAYRQLLDLKEGQVSGVVDMGNGSEFTIFKVVKFTPNVPPDFEQKKGQIRRSMEQMSGALAMRKDMDAFKKSGKLVWKSAAYHAMYDYQSALMDSSNKQKDELKAAQAAAKAALDSDKDNTRVAALAYYITSKTLYDDAKPEEKKALLVDRIKSTEDVLQDTPDPQEQLQLVDLYIASGRTDDAVNALTQTAKSLNGTGTDSLGSYEGLLARLDKLEGEGKIKSDVKDQIEKSVQAWRKMMIDEQKQRIEIITDQEKQDELNRKEIEKQKQEAARRAAAEKAKGSPATSSKTAAPLAGNTAPKGK